MKTRIPPVLLTFVLVCFALLPQAQAVAPPPDGGYPNFTTAEGQNALFSLTTGAANTAVGWHSLFSATTGSFNTGIGAGTLVLNTGDANTATGTAALLLNTTGERNTANGTAALVNNSTGEDNTAVGAFALNSNTASGNAAIGSNALLNNTTGTHNTATGAMALFVNTTGYANTATGSLALFANNTGIQNTANGEGALGNNSTGNANTAIGNITLSNNTAGSGNIALGILAGDNVTTADDVICIGAPGANVSNSCFIGQIFNATSSGGTAVFINSNGRLGTSTSSQRFKEQIKPMEQASEALFALKPVTFHYKKKIDPQGIPQFGLVAEEVEKVNPDLVVRDKDGKPYSVRYDQVNAMLLNEFLKEHRRNDEQQATIARQQKQIEALTAGLQRVSAQLEASKPVTQVVNNP